MFKFITVSVISNLIGLVLAVFVLIIAISYYNKRKMEKMDSELESKVDSYLKQHISNTESEYDDSYDYKIVGHPKLHLLRMVELDNHTVVYFLNNGSNIFNVKIDSPDVSDISIEPKNKILNKSTGCIKFSTNKIGNNEITFLLDYSDGRMNRISKKYLLSTLEKGIKEIY